MDLASRLYLRALLRGLFEGPGRDLQLRNRIVDIARRRGLEFVHRMLRRVDPGSARRIHPNDLIRTVRALEVRLLAKRPMTLEAIVRGPPNRIVAMPRES